MSKVRLLRRDHLAALGGALCLIFAPYPALAQSETSVDNRIERVLANLQVATPFAAQYHSRPLVERMRHYRTPGISIAVVDRYRIEWSRGFGVADADTGVPVTQETLFQAGSISKPIFAIAVMGMAEANQLNLDQDVNTYLTSWKIPPNDGWQPVVTLRQLLSHSAGLTVSAQDCF